MKIILLFIFSIIFFSSNGESRQYLRSAVEFNYQFTPNNNTRRNDTQYHKRRLDERTNQLKGKHIAVFGVHLEGNLGDIMVY